MANLSEIEIADLLKSLTDGAEAPKLRKNGKDADVGLFIHTIGLTHSDKAVPVGEVYNAYNAWSKRPVSKNQFTNIIGRHFKKRRILATVCVYITPETVGLPSSYTITSDPTYARVKYKKARKNRSIAYIGVYELNIGMFHAKILLSDGKYIPLGNYKFKKHAALAYDKAALQLYGRDAVLNFPKTWKDLLNGTASFPIKKPQRKGTRPEKELKDFLYDIFYRSYSKVEKAKQDSKREEDQSKEPEDSKT